MTTTISGTALNVANIGTPASGDLTNCTGVQYTGFKNRIINGNMAIDQRNAGASVNGVGGTFAYALDRWASYGSQSGKHTLQQSTITPPNYKNSLVFTTISAYSVPASELYFIDQPIEGLNVSDFGWGTASASPVTVSFWVRSSLTGTFGGSILNGSVTRSYPFAYTISAANTWEQKTITIAGDTSGTWLTTNGVGLYLSFGLGVGSTYSGTAGAWTSSQCWTSTGATSVVGTSGATFYITGVQLEKGSTATGFDYRPYGTELALCQRYFYKKSNEGTQYGIPAPYNGSVVNQWFLYWLPVPMRAIPTIITAVWSGGDPINTYPSIRNIAFNFTVGTYFMIGSTTLTASAEL